MRPVGPHGARRPGGNPAGGDRFRKANGVRRAIGHVGDAVGSVKRPAVSGHAAPEDLGVRPVTGGRAVAHAEGGVEGDAVAAPQRRVGRAEIDAHGGGTHGGEGVGRVGQPLLKQIGLFDIRKQSEKDRSVVIAVLRRACAGNHRGKRSMIAFVIMYSEPELLHVVAALQPIRRFANLLHRGQQQADQDCNDRNHDQELDQGKSETPESGHT